MKLVLILTKINGGKLPSNIYNAIKTESLRLRVFFLKQVSSLILNEEGDKAKSLTASSTCWTVHRRAAKRRTSLPSKFEHHENCSKLQSINL